MGTAYSARQSSYTQGDTINADDTNDEFDAILAALGTSGHSHDGTAGEGGAIAKLLSNTLTFGAATAGTDITITFDGESNDGVLAWMEDEDYFKFSDDILINSTEKIMFGDTASFIHQSSDGVLTIDGEATIDLNASTAVLVSNDLKLNSDAAVLGFGADNDVTLTHVADTGVLLNSTMAIQFNDASQYINAPSATVLDINATDEVEVNATLMDVNANLDVSGTIVGASTLQATTITATTAVVPDASDGAALGTTSLEWSDLYLADGAVVGFGDDQDVTLTHVADTGLLLSSTDQLQFGDSGTYIHQSADGVLDLVSDTEIELNATTIDINGAVALNGAITGATNITLSGELDAATLDISGAAAIDGAITGASTIQGTTITATTAFVPDASDGAALGTTSLEFSDLYLADGAVIGFGDDQDVTLTHVADTGLLINSTMALQFNDASQYINAPSATVLDINATDEIELNATLADVNANLDVSGTYTGGGLMTTGGNIVIPDAGNIGSASDTDAIAISSGGVVTMNQIPVFSAGINVSGGTIAGTLATAAQGNVTSLGTLTTLTVDNVIINGTTIGHTSDTDLLTLTSGVLTVAGELDATTLDISGNADIDGTTNLDVVDIDGAVQIDNTVTVGVNDQGYDVKFFGDTASRYVEWDTSADALNFSDNAKAVWGGVFEIFHDTSNTYLTEVGGSTGNVYLRGNNLILLNNSNETYLDCTTDNAVQLYYDQGTHSAAKLATTSGGVNVTGEMEADSLDIDGVSQFDGALTVGVNDQGYDVKFFGDTASAYMLWDASTDDLILGGVAKLGIGTTAPYTTSNAQIAGATSTATTSYDASNPPSAGQLDINSTDAYGTQRGGKISFSGVSGDTGSYVQSVYGSIEGRKTNTTNNQTGGQLVFKTTLNTNGVIYEQGSIADNGVVVFNEQGWSDGDFRVESDSNANMLFVDAGNNRVGIGDSSPNGTLSVAGSDTTVGSLSYIATIRNTDAYSTTPAMGLLFQGKYNSGGAYADAGGIEVSKENATDGEYGFSLGLHTRANGGAVTERLHITGAGAIGIGIAAPIGDLHLAAGAGWPSKYIQFTSDNTGHGSGQGKKIGVGAISGGSSFDIGGGTDQDAFKVYSYPSGVATQGISQNHLGHYFNNKQPAFLVYPSARITDVTGDGTAYTAAYNTEVFDQSGNFASNVFTAPLTGKYQFNVNVSLLGIVSGHTTCSITLITSNRSIRTHFKANVFSQTGAGDQNNFNGSVLTDMDASDTAYVSIAVAGGSKVVDFDGDGNYASAFSGYLVA